MDKQLFDNTFNEVKPVQNPEELYWLVDKVEQINPSVILEIGTEFGGTFKFWEEIIPPSGILIGLDLNHRIRWNINNSTKTIHLITGNSIEWKTIKEVTNILSTHNNIIDFVFIDGGHDEQTVTNDYNIYKNFVKTCGLIGFHDINDNIGVKQFWDKLNTNKESFTSKNNGIGIGIVIL